MTDLRDKFDETNELSDVIRDNCTKSSLSTRKFNFEKKQTVLKSPMQLRISLQRSHYNMKTTYSAKIKQTQPFQLNIPCPFQTTLKWYILVYIKLHIGNDMDQGQYACDVLDYNTVTWWNCDDEKVTQYPGYPMNVYNDLFSDKNQKLGKR